MKDLVGEKNKVFEKLISANTIITSQEGYCRFTIKYAARTDKATQK